MATQTGLGLLATASAGGAEEPMAWLEEWMLTGFAVVLIAVALRFPLFAISAVVATQVWQWAPPADQSQLVGLVIGVGVLAELARSRRSPYGTQAVRR